MAKIGRPMKNEILDKVKICIPPDMHKALLAIAEKEKRSFSATCCIALEEWLKQQTDGKQES